MKLAIAVSFVSVTVRAADTPGQNILPDYLKGVGID